jgi:hypothetical protein
MQMTRGVLVDHGTRSQHRPDFVIGSILALLALVWRLYCGLNSGPPQGDELLAASTAFRILQHPGFVPFQVGQDYMGTVQEYGSAGLMMLIGVHKTALRAPAAVFFASAVFITHKIVSREISRQLALAVGILMIASNSAVVRYTGAVAMPGYATAIFLAAAIAWQTFRVDRSRTLAQWVLLGALAGFGAYLFQALILQTAASLIFLATRAQLFARFRSVTRNWEFWLIVTCGVFACVLLIGVGYHFLTRRATFVAGPLDLSLLSGGLFLAGVFVILLLRVIRLSGGDLVSVASFALVFVVFQALPNLWFRYHELPLLLADGVPVWQSGTYALKHLHEWPGNARLLFNYVLPLVAIGRVESIPVSDDAIPSAIDAAGVVSVVVALLVGALLIRHYQVQKRPVLACAESLFILPLLMLVVVLFPSWRLFGSSSYRYLIVFVPGFCLGVAIAARVIANSNRVIFFGLIGLFALYSGYDCFKNFQFVPPDKECVNIAAGLLEQKVDGVLVRGKCVGELVWRAAGRVWIADPDPDPSGLFLHPRLSSIAAAKSIAAVNLDETELERILGGSAGEFTPAESLAPGVVVYRRKPS